LPHVVGVLQDPVDARAQSLDVGWIDRGEHADPQLVAAQLAVRLDVDDAVCPQRGCEGRGVDLISEVDRADDQGALWRIDYERCGEFLSLSPPVQVPR
jgi:hypothetical protein